MIRRNWKQVQPSSLRDALRLCKDHALERKNFSVEHIAELMDVTPDLLYKWLSTGKMPVSSVRAYEHICGISLVTRWQAVSAGYLVIKAPTGRSASAADMHALQETLNDVSGQLLKFYNSKVGAEVVLAAIQQGMEGLVWHKGNVEKHSQPEFEFTQEPS